MEKIRRLNRYDLEIGKNCDLTSYFGYEPLMTVKVLDIADSGVLVQLPVSFRCCWMGFSQYSIFHTRNEAVIAYSYIKYHYMINQLERNQPPPPDLMQHGFNVLYLRYLRLTDELDKGEQ